MNQQKNKDDSIQQSIQRLHSYIEDRFNNLEKRLEQEIGELRGDFRLLQNSVDAYAKRSDKYMEEMLALGTKVDRLERWIQQIADKTGVKLEY